MTAEKDTPETAVRVLFSPDGQSWASDSGQGTVVKIVIGKPPRDDAPPSIRLASDIRKDLLRYLPTVTHLHLWGIEDLTELLELPPGLECLDLRGCPQLRKLPRLPDALTTLDLGQCSALQTLPLAPPVLERFYANDCSALKDIHLRSFLQGLADAPLREFDASRTVLTTTEEIPRLRLRRLVLSGCSKLVSAEGLDLFPELDHLNLSNCSSLEELPGLPATTRFVVLHGAEKLKRLAGQDLGQFDRGLAENQNVAPILQSRLKFGDEVEVSAHAKLLLLGDGRVGKSTLAKALQWAGLSPEAKSDSARELLRPRADEPPTHRLRFWAWPAALKLPSERLESLRQRARERALELPEVGDGSLQGSVRLWDFGGQEIYHQTHRLFASEGAVYLVVWRANPADDVAIKKDVPPGCDPEQWKEYNRHRPLDYWLDYIFSLQPNARVALVCTCSGPKAKQVPWEERAPRHKDRKLECFHVDLLAEGYEQQPGFRKLMGWVSEACGAEAERIGILQPAFFQQVAGEVDSMLEENSRKRDAEDPRPHLWLDWSEWEGRVRRMHAAGRTGGPELNGADVGAITGYLHDAGLLFQLDGRVGRAVLVDQDWATEIIYEMLGPGRRLHKKILKNRGWFTQEELREDRSWKELKDETQRERLVRYLEQCRLIVPLRERENGAGIFMANEKWLLPPEADVLPVLERQMQEILRRSEMQAREAFGFGDATITEFEFRDLMAHLGRALGTRAVWYRTGLQAAPREQDPEWCFRLGWRADGPDSLTGRVEAVLVTRSEHLEALAGQVEELLTAEGSPLARLGRVQRRDARVEELSGEFILPLQGGQKMVGISSSGKDDAIVRPLVNELKLNGPRPCWYALPETGAAERERLEEFLHRLMHESPTVVLLLSDGYLKDEPASNWYCPWELADAINRWADGERSLEQTLVVFLPGQELNSQNVTERVSKVFSGLADYFHGIYTAIPANEILNFTQHQKLSVHFAKAAQKVGDFFNKRGTWGRYSQIGTKAGGGFDYGSLLDDIRKAARGA
ncbi:MAG: hypothetical protein U1G08_09100 [Verrucomicrobiota bacterium]